MCLCVYVCNHSTGRNFYSIDIKSGPQVGLVKIKAGSIGTPKGDTIKPKTLSLHDP